MDGIQVHGKCLWMPAHFGRLCAVIDVIPRGIHFRLLEESELRFPSLSGPSQSPGSHRLSESLVEDDDEPRLLDPRGVTSDISVTQASEKVNVKTPKKRLG